MVPITRTVIQNGVQKNVTELVSVSQYETRAANVKIKDVTVYDLDGLKVDPEKLPELLRKPRAVAISPDGNVSKPVRELLQKDTLVIVVAPRMK